MKKAYEIYFECGTYDNVISSICGLTAAKIIAKEIEKEYGEKPMIREVKAHTEKAIIANWGYSVF